jgi:type II secretion system (T2SS) protein G
MDPSPRGRPNRLVGHLMAALALLLISVSMLYSAIRTGRITTEPRKSVDLHQAQQQLTFVSLEFSGFQLKNGRLPRSLEELVAAKPGKMTGRSIVDPWGTPIRYEITDPQPMWYRLISAGPDRTFDTEDDLVHRVGGRP